MSPIVFKGVNEQEEPMDVVASHQRLLVGAALRTQGPILELGVGWYSTPLLHEIALTQERKLYTFDNNIDWLRQFEKLDGPFHELRLYGWWGDAYEPLSRGFPEPRWGLCFVDHAQPIEREYATRMIHKRVDVFVFHDTEEPFAYGYARILGEGLYNAKSKDRGLFPYQWTDRSQKAWTTVASAKVDVTRWFGSLPPVEPTREVT